MGTGPGMDEGRTDGVAALEPCGTAVDSRQGVLAGLTPHNCTACHPTSSNLQLRFRVY